MNPDCSRAPYTPMCSNDGGKHLNPEAKELRSSFKDVLVCSVDDDQSPCTPKRTEEENFKMAVKLGRCRAKREEFRDMCVLPQCQDKEHNKYITRLRKKENDCNKLTRLKSVRKRPSERPGDGPVSSRTRAAIQEERAGMSGYYKSVKESMKQSGRSLTDEERALLGRESVDKILKEVKQGSFMSLGRKRTKKTRRTSSKKKGNKKILKRSKKNKFRNNSKTKINKKSRRKKLS